MKSTKKILSLALAAVLALALAACGSSTPEKAINGFYQSTQDVGFFSAYPAYTFKQATFGIQTIETYSDGTYCLTNTASSFSGSLTFSDDGTHEEVPRGSQSTRYYGTFTSTEEAGLLTLTLSAPTAVVVGSSYSVGADALGYLNTEAWTDAMGERAGGENGAMSAADYLASVAFAETSVIIDTATGSFDYIALG